MYIYISTYRECLDAQFPYGQFLRQVQVSQAYVDYIGGLETGLEPLEPGQRVGPLDQAQQEGHRHAVHVAGARSERSVNYIYMCVYMRI